MIVRGMQTSSKACPDLSECGDQLFRPVPKARFGTHLSSERCFLGDEVKDYSRGI